MHIQWRLNRQWLIVVTAAFLLATANGTFFSRVVDFYPLREHFGFVVSLMVLSGALLVFVMGVLSIVVPVKVVTGFFILVAAFTGYFTDSLGTIIDASMLRNVLLTDFSEALELLSAGLVLRLVILGVLPVCLLYLVPLRRASRWREVRNTAILLTVALALVPLNLLSANDHYASFAREHRELRYYTNPLYPLYAVFRVAQHGVHVATEAGIEPVASLAAVAPDDRERELVVVVVGETARADHFSLNGYHRETTPYLARTRNIISYKHITSCGTATAVSVPCLFSFFGHDDFDVDTALRTENVLDVLARAGVHVLWRDNNSDSKGVATRVPYEDFRTAERNPVCDVECRDVGMLAGLQEYVDGTVDGDILIVLHQMGSHGPAYFKRYPREFAKFQPECRTAEFSACTSEMIVNAYDNSILYTDYFLSRVIDFLKQNDSRFETTMVYVSDHGESLGEHGLYLHGLPYLVAPEEQTHVPLVIWVGRHSDLDYAGSKMMENVPNSHDALAYMLLQLFEIRSDIGDPGLPVLVKTTEAHEPQEVLSRTSHR